MSTETKKDRVVFANKIELGAEGVDLAAIKDKIKQTSGNGVESVYKTICDKVKALGPGKAWPVTLPAEATLEAFRRALVGYAARHCDETFDIHESTLPSLVYVSLSTRKRKPKATKGEKPGEAK